MNVLYVCPRCRAGLNIRRSSVRQLTQRTVTSLGRALQEATKRQEDQSQIKLNLNEVYTASSQKTGYDQGGNILENSEQRQLRKSVPHQRASRHRESEDNDVPGRQLVENIARVPSDRVRGPFRSSDFPQKPQNAAQEQLSTTTNIGSLEYVERHLETIRLYASEGVGEEQFWTSLNALHANRSSLTSFQRAYLNTLPYLPIAIEQFAYVAIQNASDSALPQISDLTSKLKDLDLLNASRLKEVLEMTLEAALNAIYVEQAAGKDTVLVRQAILIWKLCIDKFTRTNLLGDKTVKENWDGVPSNNALMDVFMKSKKKQNFRFSDKFAVLFPGTFTHELRFKFSACALTTLFCYFKTTSHAPSDKDIDSDIKPFTESLAQLVTLTPRIQISALGKFGQDSWQNVIKGDWDQFLRRCRDYTFDKHNHSPSDLVSIWPVPSDVGLVGRVEFDKKKSPLFSDLRKAVKEDDVRLIYKLWNNHARLSAGESSEYMGNLYAEFMAGFVRLNQIEATSQVWAALKQRGIEPGMAHFIAMVDACRRQKDLESLNGVWSQVKRSNVPITNSAWNVYISALAQCREWRAIPKTVQDMEACWRSQSAAEGKEKAISEEDEDLKPSIIPLNTAMTGLIRLGQKEVADLIFEFARSNGIRANIDTFNIFIKHAVHRADVEEIQRLLGAARDADCEPDIITFTTVLDGIFRDRNTGIHLYSLKDQWEQIDRVFADMEAAGIKANALTYATILHALLPRHRPNLPAARALLERMARDGVRLSPHICSMLAVHYFNASPPDLAAVEALWRRMEKEGTIADHVFFDRLIENYASLGETKQMMRFLRMMPQRGKLPGWKSLAAAVGALVATGQHDLANQVVRTAEGQSEFARLGLRRGWRGESTWNSVVGRLRQEGIIQPKDS